MRPCTYLLYWSWVEPSQAMWHCSFF